MFKFLFSFDELPLLEHDTAQKGQKRRQNVAKRCRILTQKEQRRGNMTQKRARNRSSAQGRKFAKIPQQKYVMKSRV